MQLIPLHLEHKYKPTNVGKISLEYKLLSNAGQVNLIQRGCSNEKFFYMDTNKLLEKD